MVSQPKVLVFSSQPAIDDVALASIGRLRGAILATEGAVPMEELTVRLWDSGWRLAGVVSADSAGEFRFEGVAPGAYTVSLEVPPGYVAERTENRLMVTAKNDVLVQFVVRPTAELSGRVVDGLAPAAGVFLDLIDAAGKFVAEGTTSDTGDYSFRGLAPGQYTVRVRE